MDHNQLLAAYAAQQRELADAKAAIEAATKRAEAAEKAGMGTLRCKVATKGGVSVYGLQRTPVTLYGSQWARLIAYIPEVSKFLVEHKAELAVKVKPGTDAEPDATDIKG